MLNNLGRRISFLLNIIISILIAVDILAVIFSPFWLKAAYEKGFIIIIPALEDARFENAAQSTDYNFMLAFIIFCGIAALIILWQARHLLSNISKDNPFTKSNSVCLMRAAYGGLLIALAFTVKMFVSPSALTLLCLAVFLLFGLFMIVLSELFKQAAQIKEENELTI